MDTDTLKQLLESVEYDSTDDDIYIYIYIYIYIMVNASSNSKVYSDTEQEISSEEDYLSDNSVYFRSYLLY